MNSKWTKAIEGRFWVVGGRYSCPKFETLSWSAQALGPFTCRANAEAAWRTISYAYSASCLHRFSIVEERMEAAKAA